MHMQNVTVGEARLIRRDGGYPHMRQWRDENMGYNIVEPPKNTGGALLAGGINVVGKAARGVFTLPDKVIDQVFNPNPPEPLKQGNLLPMTQRDIRKGIKTIVNPNMIKHPIGSTVSLASTAWNAGQSLVFDAAQKLGGGRNHMAA